MSNYEGKTWQNTSGQWSWAVLFTGEILVSGSGYPSEESAQVDLDERLADYQDEFVPFDPAEEWEVAMEQGEGGCHE